MVARRMSAASRKQPMILSSACRSSCSKANRSGATTAWGCSNDGSPRQVWASTRRLRRHDRTEDSRVLQGRAMMDLYFWTTPNGYKVTILLEELGWKYNVIPVNI